MDQNPGIDYGGGITNVDDNNIHFGVISQYKLDCWGESAEPVYNGTPSEDDEEMEPTGWAINNETYSAHQACDDPDIVITHSPYYTYAKFCSPCAPGAGDLSAPYKVPEKYVETMRFLLIGDQNVDTASKVIFDLAEVHSGFPKVYCFGHECFDGDQAPYIVFSVETGLLVKGGE